MKKKKAIIGVILVVILSYFCVKALALYYYDVKNITKDNLKNIKFEDTLILNSNSNVDDYLVHEDIKIRNDFKDFEYKKTADNIHYYTLKKDNEKDVALIMGKTPSYIDYLLEEKMLTFNVNDKKVSSKERKAFLTKKDINSDIDLLKFLEKNNKEPIKNTIFTPLKEIKGYYSVMLVTSVFLPDIKSITEIKGDYKGYILNLKKSREVSIFKNKKKYSFTFINNDYFTDEYLKELLETIEIRG